MGNIIILALSSAIISFILTPIVKRIAKHFNIMDIPKDNRRIHKKPIPLLGGLAIYVSFVMVLFLKPGPLSNEEVGILIGATIITIGGFIDDKFDLKPWQKILFQLAAALSLVFTSVSIQNLTNPLVDGNSFVQIGYLAVPFTILWVIGITNAINLTDGLDGLAAGITIISGITILIIALLNGRWEAATLSGIFVGAVAGFLPYNFNPASIFMGDTGSQLLGFMLASISIQGATKTAAAFAIGVPILALGLPIYDTLFAIVRRKINGVPMMQGDRGHIHHRLLDMGLTQKQVVLVMYLISAILGGVAIVDMLSTNKTSYLLLVVVIILFILIAWRCGFFKKK
jgi:UDP-GlcNAc:undecaprenyl-phosphate/decaprenyl-phosphate GlcNAc-1-phosphate transferase